MQAMAWLMWEDSVKRAKRMRALARNRHDEHNRRTNESINVTTLRAYIKAAAAMGGTSTKATEDEDERKHRECIEEVAGVRLDNVIQAATLERAAEKHLAIRNKLLHRAAAESRKKHREYGRLLCGEVQVFPRRRLLCQLNRVDSELVIWIGWLIDGAVRRDWTLPRIAVCV